MQSTDFTSEERPGQAEAGLQSSDCGEQFAREATRTRSDWALLGESAAVRQLRSQIQRIAPYFRTALIRGETGSGKEAVARAIHALSPGADRPFVAIDAAALADVVDSSEDSGHAGTLVTAGLESARGATLYLNRVGELTLRQQATLFRFVRGCEERRGPAAIAVRILAASDRDLRTLASIGLFRQDLYACLSAVELAVPPLRQRVDDVPMLAELLLRRLTDETGQPAKVLAELTLIELKGREWPGNLRELECVVTQAAALVENGTIEPRHLLALSENGSVETTPARVDRLDDIVERHVLDVLTRCGGNKLRAAELLGISRSTLYRMLGSRSASTRTPVE